MKKPAQLTARQLRFVEEYLADLNATQAAIRAGYSPKTADVQGPRLLGNVRVCEAIDVGLARLADRNGIKADRVIRALAEVAFATPEELARIGGKICDKLTALHHLGRHFKLFTDKHEFSIADIDAAIERELARLGIKGAEVAHV
jgi:hypothetical protein